MLIRIALIAIVRNRFTFSQKSFGFVIYIVDEVGLHGDNG
jgi:hypothetical protein